MEKESIVLLQTSSPYRDRIYDDSSVRALLQACIISYISVVYGLLRNRSRIRIRHSHILEHEECQNNWDVFCLRGSFHFQMRLISFM